MSAFVVDSACMDRVVQAICARTPYGAVIPTFAGLDTQDPSNWDTIGRKLFALNVFAVCERYEDEDAMQYAWVMTYRFGGSRSRQPATVAELTDGCKALACLHYQCSEGDADKTPIYQELEAARGRVARAAIERTPAYENAGWG
jgi:hypothetical protein